MRRITIFLCFCFITAQFLAQDYVASLNIGTPGFGVSLSRSFGEKINLHAGFAWFSTEIEGGDKEKDDYIYTAKPKLMSANLLADYFPFGGSLRLRGGLFFNLNAFDTHMTPSKTYTVGNDQYTPELLGSMDAEIKYPVVAPYIGLGLGNPFSGESGLSITFDVGTFYQGTPDVDLTATGLLAPSAAEDQEKQLEDNLDWFQWFPVVSIGLNYKF